MSRLRTASGPKHGSASAAPPAALQPAHDTWTFLSNHAHVLVALTRYPNQSLREIAIGVGITERSVQRIVTDLEEAGYLKKEKVGRTNRYVIRRGLPLRHPLEKNCDVGELLELITSDQVDHT